MVAAADETRSQTVTGYQRMEQIPFPTRTDLSSPNTRPGTIHEMMLEVNRLSPILANEPLETIQGYESYAAFRNAFLASKYNDLLTRAQSGTRDDVSAIFPVLIDVTRFYVDDEGYDQFKGVNPLDLNFYARPDIISERLHIMSNVTSLLEAIGGSNAQFLKKKYTKRFIGLCQKFGIPPCSVDNEELDMLARNLNTRLQALVN